MRIFSPEAGRPVDISHAEGLSIERLGDRAPVNPQGKGERCLKTFNFSAISGV
jgi:hypothetical protein